MQAFAGILLADTFLCIAEMNQQINKLLRLAGRQPRRFFAGWFRVIVYAEDTTLPTQISPFRLSSVWVHSE